MKIKLFKTELRSIVSTLLLLVLVITQSFAQRGYPSIGKVVRIEPEFDNLVPKDAKIEVLATGFVWSEGPIWVKSGGFLLFSDVPTNTVHKWTQKEGVTTFLKPSGFTGLGFFSNEPGSNGLTINLSGELVSAEHGDRRISAMPLSGQGKRTLADKFEGKKLNSPNDVVQHSSGAYYFTDPPYGLASQQDTDPLKEQNLNGVYRIGTDGSLKMVVSNLSRPNGLAFSHDEKLLYVAQSDQKAPTITSYPVNSDGSLGEGKVFYDTKVLWAQGLRGGPDGLKVDKKGNVWSTGPGGVIVLSPEGKLLGRIETGEATANCAFGDDGSTLYLTADFYLCRIKTSTIGAGF
ncbi:MAG: SMP-30/gluconolactonase/LRE family protein [Bacteroidota bacterium]